MTIIVGYRDTDGRVVLGADSVGVAGYERDHRKDQKLFISHGIGYAFTSSYRMGQILQFHSEKLEFRGDTFQFVVSELVPMWRRILRDHGYTFIDGNREEGGTFLVALQGRLFTIHSDFQVAEPELPYDARGCGASYALGAFYALETTELSSTEKVFGAMGAATKFSAGCGGPLKIIVV